jgi:hypothetical protein
MAGTKKRPAPSVLPVGETAGLGDSIRAPAPDRPGLAHSQAHGPVGRRGETGTGVVHALVPYMTTPIPQASRAAQRMSLTSRQPWAAVAAAGRRKVRSPSINGSHRVRPMPLA